MVTASPMFLFVCVIRIDVKTSVEQNFTNKENVGLPVAKWNVTLKRKLSRCLYKVLIMGLVTLQLRSGYGHVIQGRCQQKGCHVDTLFTIMF